MPLPQQANLRDYWGIILKRKKAFFIVMGLVLIITLVFTTEKQIELKYLATSKIAMEGAFVRVDPLPGQNVVRSEPWVELNPIYMETQFQIIKSNLVIDRAIKILGWDTQDKDFLVNRIKNQITVNQPTFGDEDRRARGLSSLIVISAIDSNPREAMEIANAVTQAYIELRKEERELLIESVYAKLEEQVRDVKAKLDVSEKALEEFKKKEGFIALEGKTDLTVQTIQQLNERLIRVRGDIAEDETLLKTILELWEKDNSAALSLIAEKIWKQNPVNLALKQKLLNTQNELNNLLQIYKEKHPEVIRVRSELALIKEQVENEVKGIISSLRFNIESNRKFEQTLIGFLQKPDFGEKQVKYMDLQREVALNKDLYTNLLRRLKEMDITEQVASQPEVRIIEFASLPMHPLPSPKKKGKALSLPVALILAMMTAFLLEYLDNTLKTIEDVETYLDTPVLGIIPHISSDRKKILTKHKKRINDD